MRTLPSASESASAHIQRKKRPAGTVRTRPDILLLVGATASMLLTVCLLRYWREPSFQARFGWQTQRSVLMIGAARS
jgi:hypothetical protein